MVQVRHLFNMVSKIPENVFLDTNVVNFFLKFREQIHDGAAIPAEATRWEYGDIEALRGIWLTGQRANWRLTISPTTIAEIQRTSHAPRLHALLGWASELWAYSEEWAATCSRNTQPTRDLMSTLSLLPEPADRRLIREAAAADCDAFCTRDWNTILRLRDSLRDVPLSFVSPHEWWQGILPYAALFV